MRASNTVVLLLMLFPSSLCATEEEQPSLELLEYLGNWDDTNGSWIDPQLLLPTEMSVVEGDDETVDKQNDE